jgi:hypothetical protein
VSGGAPAEFLDASESGEKRYSHSSHDVPVPELRVLGIVRNPAKPEWCLGCREEFEPTAISLNEIPVRDWRKGAKVTVGAGFVRLGAAGTSAFNFAQSKRGRLKSATDAITLPNPEPRALREHFVVPSIGSRDVAWAEWPYIGRVEHFL